MSAMSKSMVDSDKETETTTRLTHASVFVPVVVAPCLQSTVNSNIHSLRVALSQSSLWQWMGEEITESTQIVHSKRLVIQPSSSIWLATLALHGRAVDVANVSCCVHLIELCGRLISSFSGLVIRTSSNRTSSPHKKTQRDSAQCQRWS